MNPERFSQGGTGEGNLYGPPTKISLVTVLFTETNDLPEDLSHEDSLVEPDLPRRTLGSVPTYPPKDSGKRSKVFPRCTVTEVK